MKVKSLATMTVPDDVYATVKDRVVTVKGPRGTLVKSLRHLQLDFAVSQKMKTISAIRWFGYKTDVSCLNTALAHIRNMITGVTRGFRFKLRFASAHFPINVGVEGDVIEIRNFLGEKRVRKVPIPSDLKIYRTDPTVTKDELVIEGNDLEEVSKKAAAIHNLCLVKNKDIRKFLDGIYVMTKTNIVSDE